MAQKMQDLWPKVLEELKRQVSPQQFQTWFSKVHLLGAEDDSVDIQVPNTLYKEWLSKSYKGLLEDAFSAVGQAPREVRFTVEGPSPPLPLHIASSSRLNKDYTFENFVVGPANRLAHAAALAVVESPGCTYNPLFLEGGVGLGKTHLLQAICLALRAKSPGLRVLYLPCEAFVNHYIYTIKSGCWEDFRGLYRGLDALIIDDVSFLSHSQRFREEFFHTFNSLYNAQRQIVLSSSCPPEEIPSLEERLVSRFKWGLVAKIDPPDYETRVAIIEQKASSLGLNLLQDVVSLLAETVTANTRELVGTILSLSRFVSLNNCLPTVEVARQVVFAARPRGKQTVPIEDILTAVSGRFGVSQHLLQSKKRTKSVVVARHVAMYLARRLTALSLKEIGGFIGGRDHSTVIHADAHILALRDSDKPFCSILDALEADLLRSCG